MVVKKWMPGWTMACMKMNEMHEEEHVRLLKKAKILHLSWNQHITPHGCEDPMRSKSTLQSTLHVLFPTWAAWYNS